MNGFSSACLRVFFPLLLFLLAVLPAAPVRAETLVLLNWQDYLSERVIERWTAQTGVEIEQIYFDSDERRDEILANLQHRAVDLVVIDEMAAQLFADRGRLARVPTERLVNLRHLEPHWRQRCGQSGVPYFWGTLGLAYRSDKLSQPPRSWRALLRPDPALKGHIGMLSDPTDTLTPPLLLLDHSIHTGEPARLKDAYRLLVAQLPDVLTYDYAITYLQSGAEPDRLHLALVYSGDQFTLDQLSGGEGRWQYVVPDEGSTFWLDCLSVVGNSDKQPLAWQFIDFLNQPEIAALNAGDVYVATPNRAAYPLLDAALRNDPAVYPDPAVLARSQFYRTMSMETIRLRQRITSALRKLHATQ